LGKIAKKEASSKDFIVDIKRYVAEIIKEGRISSNNNIKFENSEKVQRKANVLNK
jgi:hypothetical protein